MKKTARYGLAALILIFALIGVTFTAVFIGMQLGLLNVRGSIAERDRFFNQTSQSQQTPDQVCADASETQCEWAATPEWAVLKAGFTKDAPVIDRVSQETGVPARMIVAVAVPEQIRFFTSEREVFKRYFEPLKILGSLSQFSLGISGIKQETATQIERYANDPSSPLYPGDGIAALIAYSATSTHDTELYNRLTDSKDHYYSYLYTAIFIKELDAQWGRAGFDISRRAGVITTLFNIGFQHSSPNANPGIGGADISTGGHAYTYGTLGDLFYNSQELQDVFPR